MERIKGDLIIIKILVLDSDYNFNRLNEPVLRIFGKIVGGDLEGQNVALHILSFEPYIYIDNCGYDIFELQKVIETKFHEYVKRVEIVKKFKPIGYQSEKTNVLRIVLHNPKVVPELRDSMKVFIKELTDSQIYEADIPFKNRCLIDLGIDGMKVIEFNEVGKKIDNYGLNCKHLFVCNKEDVRLVNENVMIEY